jgi:hypothetical protein
VLHYSQDHLGTGMCDLDHPIICWCRKHRQLTYQEGGFAVCFPLDILMVYSLKLTCYVKFMAIPSYANLKLKIPGPTRVITMEAKTQ